MASNQTSIIDSNADTAKNFIFSKKAQLIQRAKKLQAHQTTDISSLQQPNNPHHNTEDNYQDLKRNPLTESEKYEDRPLQQIHQEPTWKFIQQSDNNTAEPQQQQKQVLQQNYSGLETSKMTETESSGEEENHMREVARRGKTDMTITNCQEADMMGQSQRTYDERTSETNSQFQYDQGRPDLLQRLRSIQGYQQKDQQYQTHQAPEDSMEQSNTMSSANEQMSEPQIINAPRQMIPQNAEVVADSRQRSQNKMNLQIEIESEHNNQLINQQHQDVQSFSSANKNDILNSSVTTIEQSNECIKISDLVELQKHKTLEVERLNNNSLLNDGNKNYNEQLQYQQNSSHNDSSARYGDEQSLSQQQQRQQHQQNHYGNYTGNVPLDHQQSVDVKSDDVHPLPQIIPQSRNTNAQHQHARYQSSQGISSPAAYGQNGLTHQTSQQNARGTNKNSSAQDSGTVYATCRGSSQEKHGRNGTLSFHTAQSQILPNEDGQLDLQANLQYQQQQQRYMDPEERLEILSLDGGVNSAMQKQNYIQKSSNKQRPESAREPMTSSTNKNQQTNSKFIRQGSSAKRRNHNHTGSINYYQGQRSSTDGLNGPNHNQFSFGHLQSSDGQMGVMSEVQMVRDYDSINQQSNSRQQIKQIGAKDSILSQTNTDEQNTTTALNQDLIQGGHQQQLQQHQYLQQQENAPYTSVHTSSQMEKDSLYHQLFNQVRQQLEHQQQQQQKMMPPTYQVRQESQNKRTTTTIETNNNIKQHAVSTSDRKFEEYLVARNHQNQNFQQQQNLAAKNNEAGKAVVDGKPPKFRMRKPETFNESMYQRSQAWLQQKTQKVQMQKRESALKEAEECTFNPNSTQLTTTSQSINMMQQTQSTTAGTKKRRSFNSTQRSKRSQVRQRDQLINHSGHHHHSSVTPQSYLNQTMHFKQKNYSRLNETQNNLSMVNDTRLHTDTSPIANFDNSYTTTINNDRSQSRDESTIIQDHQRLQQEQMSPKFVTMVQYQPPSRNSRNLMSYNSMNMHNNQHQSIVSSGLGSQFNTTVRVKSATSADYRARQARLISDKRHRQPNFQDGNLTSFRAIESYQKHLERQTAKIEKKIEAEEAEKKRPGSGNLWRYKLTQPASPKLRSLERSRLKEYARNKKTFLRGDGLSKSTEREGRVQGSIGGGSNSIDSCGKHRTQQITSTHNTIQPVIGNSNRSPSKRIDMSVLCQSTNMKESLIRAKNGLSLDDSQKFSSQNYASGSHTPFIVSQQLQNLSSKQPTSYRNQMMAQKANQKSQKNQQHSSRKKTSFIRPKSSCAKKASTQSNKKEARPPSSTTYSQQKAKKQIKQHQQLQQFVEMPQMGYSYSNQYHQQQQQQLQQHQRQQQQQQQQFMTCQSTMSNFAKANDMISQINPHSSIQTQLIPDGLNEPLLMQMNENQKSNTQIIDISQFNTLNENASAFRDSTSQLQDRCSRPSSSVNGAPINLITTGGYTVEHAGGTGMNTEDDQSFNTNIDFLGHFGATSSIMGDQIPQTNDVVGHNQQIMAESGQHLFESFNPYQQLQQRQQKQQQNYDYIEHSNPHMQVIEENRKSSTSANEVLMMPHQHRYGVIMEDDQPGSGDYQAAMVSKTASTTALYPQAEQINIKEFIRNQIGGL